MKPYTGNADATALRRDIERWKIDLNRWEAAGMVNSEPTLIIRGWIGTVEKWLAPSETSNWGRRGESTPAF
jgi:hypothetical protein